jgi:hypothetical protein
MLGLLAKTAGRRPSELMPPIESEVLALDFDVAVIANLHRFEQQQEAERTKALARLTAIETARAVGRLFLPVWGYELKEPGAPRSACNPHVFVDGKCRGCDLQQAGNGQLRYGDAPAECDEHEFENGVCVKCGGRNTGAWWVTRPTPRVIECSHERHEPFQGQLRCLDCGSVGN